MPPTLDFASPLSTRGPRLSDLVFERLADAIVEGTLGPGELLRDHALAEQLGVSRMPVREAIQRLERAGLVETAASRYTRVAGVSSERVADTMEYAGYVYGSAARMAVVRMDEDELASAVVLLDTVLAAAETEACVRAGRAFYRYLMQNTRNEMYAMRRDLTFTVERVAREFPFADLRRRLDAHGAELRRALLLREGDAAEAAVRRMHDVA